MSGRRAAAGFGSTLQCPELYAQAVDQVPDSIRPTLDMPAERVDFCEIVHRD